MLRASFLALLASLLAILSAGCSASSSGTTPDPGDPKAESSPTNPTDGAAATPRLPSEKPISEDALVPVVTSITPNRATVGAVGPTVVVTGTNFVDRSIVQLDGSPLATTFVSGTELRATIPTAKLVVAGALRLSVGTSPPGGGASDEVSFNVDNPRATLTSLSPLSLIVGSSTTTLTAKGSDFIAGAQIVFGTTELPTTFTSVTELTASIPASLLSSSGSVPVKVVNPSPGGGESTSLSFTIANPVARITSVLPAGAVVGSGAIPVTIKGTGFVTGSLIIFNGLALTTTFVNARELQATLPSASLASAGELPITIRNPEPGGGVIAPVIFRVGYPVPVVSSLAPASVSVGTGPTPVTVTGTGFFPASEVTVDGDPTATTYQDATHLVVTLEASRFDRAGKILIRVTTPTPGGGTSASVALTVNNAVPSIVSLNPSTVAVGSADRTITISGRNFVTTTTANSNGALVMSTYVNATTLTAVIPATHIQNPGTVAITVTNPAPGGGTSSPANLTVGCDSAGVDVSLNAVGATTTLATNFASAPLMPRFIEGGTCPATAASFSTAPPQPARFWVVQNGTGVPVTLSTWADCTEDGQQGDAYMTFYRRSSAPTTTSDRQACSVAISEGVNSGYASPESGASTWCPGLTKSNGGGLSLGVCEKAVVSIQPFSSSSPTFTPPPKVRFKAE